MQCHGVRAISCILLGVKGWHLVGILVRGCRCASWYNLFALPKCVHLPYLSHLSLITKVYGLLQLIIISPDESRGYIGFRSVAPPPPP